MIRSKLFRTLIPALLLCALVLPAAADTYATSGDGEKTVCFYVDSYGNAQVSFTQEVGLCYELSYTHAIDGIMGNEDEWGMYHIYVISPSGSVSSHEWNKVFRSGSFAVYIKGTGLYTVRVVPYTADEINDVWDLDHFVSWTRQPAWRVTGSVNCSVTARQQTRDGSVTVRCYDENGSLIRTTSVTVSQSGTVSPPAISGYRAVSSGKYVTLNTASGSCSPGQIDFYYAKERTNDTYDMGIPNIGSRVYRSGDKNMTVFWVQTQLKATGNWYQGDNWDCTGNLGDHTVQEIRSFMRSRGYSGHSGNVDQTVINELAGYLGGRVKPVYVGGFYDYMGSIMTGGSAGSMNTIDSQSPGQSIRWVQTCLKYLGYYSGYVDGDFGSGTERAVKAFQRANGWVEREYVTLGVARAMLEAYYNAGGSLSALP